jgi:energy-converting hydrogenase Eha subunit A
MSSDEPASEHLALMGNIHGRLEQLGLDPVSRDWLVKALHPAASHQCPGVPDESLAQVITPDYRTSVTVSVPAGVPGPTWDLCVIQTPGDTNCIWWAAGPSGTDFSSPVGPLGFAAGVVSAQPAGWIQPVQGTRILPVGFANALYDVQQLTSAPFRWRHRYLGLTCYMVASALVDQGTVYAAVIPSGSVCRAVGTASNMTGGFGNLAMYKAIGFNVPLDEASLQLVSPKPYVSQARHGVYLPARFLGPAFPFTGPEYCRGEIARDAGAGGPFTVLPWGNLPPHLSFSPLPVVPHLESSKTGPDNGSYLQSWMTFASLNPTSLGQVYGPLDSAFSAMTTSVVIFRGVDRAASITIRGVLGLEVVPRIDSPSRQFVRTAAMFSPRALAAYHEIAAVMEGVYPAKYNALGTLLGVVSRLVAPVLPFLRDSATRALGSVARAGAASLGTAILGPPTRSRLAEVQRVSYSDPRPPRARSASTLRSRPSSRGATPRRVRMSKLTSRGSRSKGAKRARRRR